jgi:cell wall-associated NlpC family hydrolase
MALAVAIIPMMSLAAQPEPAVVVVPVADVWNRPLAADEKPADGLRETQVLFGETVLIHESSGSWARIEAIEQPEFTHHNKWEGYPGWVLKTALGPPRADSQPKQNSGNILNFAAAARGTPYLWGGLSAQGYDCSGLIHLAYRLHGIKIPRDAHEQWMKATPIKRVQLKPADLVFSAKADNPKKITHVALYAGDGQIIEAPQTGMAVRKISFKEKYGQPLEKVESGNQVGDKIIFFGSFLH